MIRGRHVASGYEVSMSELKAAFGKKFTQFLKALTVKQKKQPGMPMSAIRALKVHSCYIIKDDRITLPRRVAWNLCSNKILSQEDVIEPPGVFGGVARQVRKFPEDLELGVTLYPYQQMFVEHVLENYLTPEKSARGEAQVYMNADTGTGKTFMTMGLIARKKVPTLITVVRKNLAKDMVSAAELMFPTLKIGMYENSKEKRRIAKGEQPMDGRTYDIVVVMLNTARDKAPEFFESYGMIVMDELHTYCSPVSSVMFYTAQAPYIVGLSATSEERTDGMDPVAYKYMGKPVKMVDVVPEEYMRVVDFEGHIREVHYKGHPDYITSVHNTSGTMSAVMTIGRIVSDPHRLELVSAEVDRLVRMHETLDEEGLRYWGLGPDPETGKIRRHCVFVFAEHRDYLPEIRESLLTRIKPEELLCEELDASQEGGGEVDEAASALVLRGGATNKEIDTSKIARVVLTTYGYSGTGTSIPHMTAMVKASPRRNGSKQIDGRIKRVSKDPTLLKIRRCIVDIRDVDTGLNSQSGTRRAAYRQNHKGWPIYQVKCGYKDFGVGDKTPASEEETYVNPPRARTTASAADGATGRAPSADPQSEIRARIEQTISENASLIASVMALDV